MDGSLVDATSREVNGRWILQGSRLLCMFMHGSGLCRQVDDVDY